MLFRILIAVSIGMLCTAYSAEAPAQISKSGGEIDWSAGLNQETPASCGAFESKNSKDGAMYGLLVKGPVSSICSFHEQGLVFHMPNDFGPTIAGKATLFSFTRIGNDVYVAWVRPYD